MYFFLYMYHITYVHLTVHIMYYYMCVYYIHGLHIHITIHTCNNMYVCGTHTCVYGTHTLLHIYIHHVYIHV